MFTELFKSFFLGAFVGLTLFVLAIWVLYLLQT